MNQYKWTNKDSTEVQQLSDKATLAEGGEGWKEFQKYLAGECRENGMFTVKK